MVPKGSNAAVAALALGRRFELFADGIFAIDGGGNVGALRQANGHSAGPLINVSALG